MNSSVKKLSVAVAAALFVAACGGSAASPSAIALPDWQDLRADVEVGR